MSRSNPTPTNPSTRFIKWSGSTGDLVYWDKELEEEIKVNLPHEFMVLDQLATITGFSEADKSQYWSNEVRSIAKDEFHVKTSNGTKDTGLYKDLADVRSKGAKYAKSIYIAYKDSGEWKIGNFKAYGACLTSWIEFGKGKNLASGKIVLTGSEKATKGATTYYIPTFEQANADTDEDEIAISLDKELQKYLDESLSKGLFSRGNDETPEYTDDEAPVDNDELDLSQIPF